MKNPEETFIGFRSQRRHFMFLQRGFGNTYHCIPKRVFPVLGISRANGTKCFYLVFCFYWLSFGFDIGYKFVIK